MQILITGGFGYIGGRLAKHLYNAGHHILLGSRRSVAPPEWLPRADITKTVWDNQRELDDICANVDIIIHAAGMSGKECTEDPVKALIVNGVNTTRLLISAINCNVKRFIYLSTVHVYDAHLSGIISENNCSINLHPYATSHLAGEDSVLYANQHEKVEGFVLRISNGFGSPIHKNVNCWMLLVNDLCRQAVENKEIILKTNGLQQRDFISIKSICNVIENFVCLKSQPNTHAVFNVGSGISFSVLEMARMIQKQSEKILGFEIPMKFPKTNNNKQHEIFEYKIDKIEALGMKTDKDFTEEIDDLIHFCINNFN